MTPGAAQRQEGEHAIRIKRGYQLVGSHYQSRVANDWFICTCGWRKFIPREGGATDARLAAMAHEFGFDPEVVPEEAPR